MFAHSSLRPVSLAVSFFAKSYSSLSIPSATDPQVTIWSRSILDHLQAYPFQYCPAQSPCRRRWHFRHSFLLRGNSHLKQRCLGSEQNATTTHNCHTAPAVHHWRTFIVAYCRLLATYNEIRLLALVTEEVRLVFVVLAAGSTVRLPTHLSTRGKPELFRFLWQSSAFVFASRVLPITVANRWSNYRAVQRFVTRYSRSAASLVLRFPGGVSRSLVVWSAAGTHIITRCGAGPHRSMAGALQWRVPLPAMPLRIPLVVIFSPIRKSPSQLALCSWPSFLTLTPGRSAGCLPACSRIPIPRVNPRIPDPPLALPAPRASSWRQVHPAGPAHTPNRRTAGGPTHRLAK